MNSLVSIIQGNSIDTDDDDEEYDDDEELGSSDGIEADEYSVEEEWIPDGEAELGTGEEDEESDEADQEMSVSAFEDTDEP